MNIDKQIQQKVTELLNWSDEMYSQFVLDSGNAYLEKVTGQYPAVLKQISASKNFWSWWQHHWEQRDKEFIEIFDGWIEGYGAREEYYRDHNDPQQLFAALYLNGQVLQESYAKLIGEITKAQKHEPITA